MDAAEGFGAARAALRERFGYARFRPAQEAVVRAVLSGSDVLGVLPTGGGKSVCFQVPALLASGLTVVVSPLISLMQDQVAGARRRGIPAVCLTSAATAAEHREAERALRSGAAKLLYVAPERLASSRFRRLLETEPVSRLAVDEAHCISEWGHDFRPCYRRIARFREAVGGPPTVALTATATPATRADVVSSLGLRDPVQVICSVDRPNLRWAACRAPSLEAGARFVIREVRSGTGAAIVYLATRRRAVRMAEALRRLGTDAAPYHAGMRPAERAAVQEAFLGGGLRVVCATNAFGMGIDHPRVRLVCHLGLPGSLEAYVQEAGRAGRDGKPARCVLVACPGDELLQREFIRRRWPSGRALSRAWKALPEGRAVTAEEVRGNGLGRLDGETLASAFRILAEFGCARLVRAPDGTEALVRGPERLRRRLDFGAPRRGRRRSLRRFRGLLRYLGTRGCRRAAIAAYFGESAPPCSGCDRCDASLGRRSPARAPALRASTPSRPRGAAGSPPGSGASGPGGGRTGRRARPVGPARSAP